jgi:hypothetical protein
LPKCDEIIDILAEIQNQPNQTSNTVQQDRQPLIKRIQNKYFESGIIGVLEDLNSLSNTALVRSNKLNN